MVHAPDAGLAVSSGRQWSALGVGGVGLYLAIPSNRPPASAPDPAAGSSVSPATPQSWDRRGYRGNLVHMAARQVYTTRACGLSQHIHRSLALRPPTHTCTH